MDQIEVGLEMNAGSRSGDFCPLTTRRPHSDGEHAPALVERVEAVVRAAPAPDAAAATRACVLRRSGPPPHVARFELRVHHHTLVVDYDSADRRSLDRCVAYAMAPGPMTMRQRRPRTDKQPALRFSRGCAKILGRSHSGAYHGSAHLPGPHRPEAQDVALSRPKHGFESRWGRHSQIIY